MLRRGDLLNERHGLDAGVEVGRMCHFEDHVQLFFELGVVGFGKWEGTVNTCQDGGYQLLSRLVLNLKGHGSRFFSLLLRHLSRLTATSLNVSVLVYPLLLLLMLSLLLQ